MKEFKRISKKEMIHTGRGVFRYENRKPVEMLKGGHGNDNIKYLTKNHLPYKIMVTYKDGVKAGHIYCHRRASEKKKKGHLWFPSSWDNKTIEKAGLHVANLKKNQCVSDHTPMHGKYKGVDVVVYKSRGRICGVCPKFGVKRKEDENEKK